MKQQQQVIVDLETTQKHIERQIADLQGKIDQQLQRNEDLEEDLNCSICSVNRRGVIFLCGH